MADATSGDTSSTPTAAAAAPATAPASAPTTQPVAATTETTPATASPAPAKTDSTPATTAATVETASTEPAVKAPPGQPAFVLPADLKLAPEAVTKFETFLKAKSVDAEGKFTMSPQELVDNYADQARTAYERWQTQMTAQDKTWEAESKARFTAPQLAAAETGIGYLTSYEPAFRDLAKGYRNNPAFVNAMRIVGERLSEDNFEPAGSAPTPAKRSAKDIMYPKRATN